jgi:hypothetical protein
MCKAVLAHNGACIAAIARCWDRITHIVIIIVIITHTIITITIVTIIMVPHVQSCAGIPASQQAAAAHHPGARLALSSAAAHLLGCECGSQAVDITLGHVPQGQWQL